MSSFGHCYRETVEPWAGIVPVRPESRKRDDVPNFNVAPQQEASQIAFDLAKSEAENAAFTAASPF
jgi:hypothetical protein